MRTIEYLTSYPMAYLPGLLAAIAVGLIAGLVSVGVVLRRMAFAGQGISHSVFAGAGAAVLAAALGADWFARGAGLWAVLLLAAVLAAVWIGSMTGRRGQSADTAIGVVLSVCMAAGFLMHAWALSVAPAGARGWLPGIEELLFGSLTRVGWLDAGLAWGFMIVIGGSLVVLRRPLAFWMFDPIAAESAGLRVGRLRLVFVVLVAAAVVAVMKIAGIVLATALLVLPGAAALSLSRRSRVVAVVSLVFALLGTLLGVVTSWETDMATGPTTVGVLSLVYAGCVLVGAIARSRGT